MTKKIQFTKMHGLGNDFVIINKKHLQHTDALQELSVTTSDRHTGIGCDQFIVYDECPEHYEMIIYNIDGSRAKLCGNASRCLAKLIYLESGVRHVLLKVGSRILTCDVHNEDDISVNVGPVSFIEEWMPPKEEIWAFAQRYMVDLKETICVDIGNPHLVIFSTLPIADKEIIGKQLQDHRLFSDGINVNFVEIKDDKIHLAVWERGVGFTLACGSGACASFAASVKLGFVGSSSEVIFPLGSLLMSQVNNDIIMRGLAYLVAKGEFFYE